MSSPLGLITSTDKFKISTDYIKKTAYRSIFNRNKYYYRPITSNEGSSSKSATPHGSDSDIYNITTNSIIDYTAKYNGMILRTQDFAYLKDYGVYPNNRLIVVRRFASPVGDDLTEITHKPISTLISWYKGEKNPVKVTFGEQWENGEGNIIEMLDNMFNTKKLGGGLGALDSLFKGGVPMPGFSEGLQFQLLEGLGVTDKNLQNVPSGNPNLIQESKKRRLVGDGGGSAMTTDISIDFETTYEQKFIGGNDPTLVYMDIINNILRFGSSESNFYINGKGGGKLKEFFKMFKDGKWIEALSLIVNAIVEVLKNVISDLLDAVSDVTSAISGAGGDFGGLITGALSKIGGAVISKYRVQIGGIISSLTGDSSTPWHVQIGNPKSPIFSSGDMLTQKVTIELGETLAFNDLPSLIKVNCTLVNARNMGIQEIFSKYNSGRGRSYINISKTRLETPTSIEEIDASLEKESEAIAGITEKAGTSLTTKVNDGIDSVDDEGGTTKSKDKGSSGNNNPWS